MSRIKFKRMLQNNLVNPSKKRSLPSLLRSCGESGHTYCRGITHEILQRHFHLSIFLVRHDVAIICSILVRSILFLFPISWELTAKTLSSVCCRIWCFFLRRSLHFFWLEKFEFSKKVCEQIDVVGRKKDKEIQV